MRHSGAVASRVVMFVSLLGPAEPAAVDVAQPHAAPLGCPLVLPALALHGRRVGPRAPAQSVAKATHQVYSHGTLLRVHRDQHRLAGPPVQRFDAGTLLPSGRSLSHTESHTLAWPEADDVRTPTVRLRSKRRPVFSASRPVTRKRTFAKRVGRSSGEGPGSARRSRARPARTRAGARSELRPRRPRGVVQVVPVRMLQAALCVTCSDSRGA